MLANEKKKIIAVEENKQSKHLSEEEKYKAFLEDLRMEQDEGPR